MIDRDTKTALRRIVYENVGRFMPRDVFQIGTENKGSAYIGYLMRHRLESWDFAVEEGDLITSPIEAQLFAHLLFVDNGSCAFVRFNDGPLEPDGWSCYLEIQAPIGKYRADFLFTTSREGGISKLAVECDGHDFHEKTKEQAAHDKKRDRFFAAQGIALLRFTGSEIYRDASACAEEVEGLLETQFQELADRK